jgi:hypothetical protein
MAVDHSEQKSKTGKLIIFPSDKKTNGAKDRISIVMTANGYQSVKNKPSTVSFNREELDAILHIYGFMVGESEWKDYAIDHLKDRAVFSIFRKTGEIPYYKIEKIPKLSNKQGAFCITGANGIILKRGKDLRRLLKYFDKKLSIVNY